VKHAVQFFYIIKNSVFNLTGNTLCISIVNTSYLMLFREIIFILKIVLNS
jgi:hypothetical protein